MSLRTAGLLALSALLAAPVHAQTAHRTLPPTPEALAYTAVRLEPGQRPRVDGVLDEAVWVEAPRASGFVQRAPNPGDPATERTEVAVLYDDDALYVAFWAYARDPETIVARLARRDESIVTDRVSVDIDSYNDDRTAFSFAVTAGGVKQDYLIYNDVQEDVTWDAVWEGKAGRFTDAAATSTTT